MREERTGPEEGSKPEKKPYKPGACMKFTIVLLAVWAVTAVLFLLLAWVSYRMRFSTEVIRMGITGLYVVPCLIGGRLIKRLGLTPAIALGAVLGTAFYGVLLVVSWLEAGMNTLAVKDYTELLLCVAAGMLGAILGKKHTKDKAEQRQKA